MSGRCKSSMEAELNDCVNALSHTMQNLLATANGDEVEIEDPCFPSLNPSC